MCRQGSRSSLGVFARKSLPKNVDIPQCCYRVWKIDTVATSPRLCEGRVESYTFIEGRGLHFLAGPASLINASCHSCANVTIQLDQLDDIDTAALCLRTLKDVNPDEELLACYGFDYRPDMFCCVCKSPLTESGNVDEKAKDIPHVPIPENFKGPNFNPLATSDYVSALHEEASGLDLLMAKIKNSK
jgi:hypothetical protein